MTDIHSTAIVSPKAELADNVVVGPYTIIEDDVVIGKGCSIVSSARIASGVVLGENVQVFHGAVIGTVPQDLKFKGEKTRVRIGDGAMVREYATVNRGTAAHGETVVGRNCLLMAYSHIAHDCIIGDNVILANSVNLAGHIEIDEWATVGGVVPIHQFVKIGAHAMIGGGFRVQQDICPYSLVAGYPLKVVGLNSTGLKRRGFGSEKISVLEKAFRILFFSKLNTTQAVERLKSELEATPEIQVILNFLDRSERGIVK
jgi:UDP-N-acetylglucosamine acyltransferase